ncbi:MAG: ATP-dependent zinc metalloprotease FtsH [Planctomycetia bacterium]|nr:ATP-dependent zinc metalloprotease FtsH [Planctomycetia bacterium]
MSEPEKKEDIPPQDSNNPSEKDTNRSEPAKKLEEEDPQMNMLRILAVVLAVGLILWYLASSLMSEESAEINFGFFRQQLEQKNIESVAIQNGTRITGEFKNPPLEPESPKKEKNKDKSGKSEKKERKKLPKKFVTVLPSPLEAGGALEQQISKEVGDKFHVTEPVDMANYMMLLSFAIMVILVGSIWFQFRRTRDQLGGGPMGFTRSPAKRFQVNEDSVTFKDVAGLEGVKQDLFEIVDFLKEPEKFERLGARIPKGVLMCGPPGTGKTLMARAIVGEADVPFFSINASEFVQMFVGVGASRVRDMFETARNSAPSILFIDEIDAVGRQRGTGMGGGNDEREQTLNQILSEMDGFSTGDVVIVIAATNRPDVLDPALLRPGRFDRHVTVSRPAQKGRVQLFEVHTKKVPLADDVDKDRLASMTTGLTGADIRNIVNEAALWACRHNADQVTMEDFYYAIDKILMGAKRDEVISDREKKMTAYHEAGHTLMAWFNPGRDRIGKVSIIPRGAALGVTQLIPEEDRVSIGQREIESRLVMMLGGREAEKLVFSELTAGAEGDLQRATELAQKMVTAWGMSPRIGPAAFRSGEEHPFLGKEMATPPRNFSDRTAQMIDEEVMRILNEASDRAISMLTEKRNQLDALAVALETYEELDELQIENILGAPAYRNEKEAEKEAEDD